ncbi:hypothetical protein K4K54_011406 [Colletotrichum sp. SAR 10_86]|nr:hypothetical protein K4K52_008238 [Colletotrichum sp. SAR 10_76]KAI8237700.1 hypothetical protein K4K54_011406 [Colletotrichum sp. SAR 10_86]KAJ5007682.1 hypothetical protein K4K48_011788 [Colletotrichum sp. SAR 10_66]
MKTSAILLSSLLAQGSLAAIAVFASETAGGTAGLTFDVWYWDGPPVDDWADLVLHSANTDGCNYGTDIKSATITNYKGESIEVPSDGCKEISTCVSSGLGGVSINGWQCDF